MCEVASDCEPGRICDQGFCVKTNGSGGTEFAIDAATSADAAIAPPDSPPDARLCAGGDARATDENGACFVFFSAKKTKADAAASCTSQSMHLAIIRSAATNATVQSLVVGVDAFIGASDAVTEGQFLWPDGTGLTFTKFRAGEPNNANGQFQEDCLIIEGALGGTWDDRACAPPPVNTGVFAYVCQFD